MDLKCVIYLRISHDPNDTELGVARQREDCLKLAAGRGWDVVQVFVDNDISGYSGRRREGFEDMLALVNRGGVNAVVARDMSRLTRNDLDRVHLLDACMGNRTRLEFVEGATIDPSDPTGRLVADVLGSVAAHASREKAAWQRRAIRQAAEQGRRVGGRRPFGYDDDGMGVREDEAQAIARGYDDFLKGVKLADIARAWTDAGHTTPQGSAWTIGSVSHVLRNPRNAGLRAVYDRSGPGRAKLTETFPAAWPRLVPESTWRACADVLDARKGRGGTSAPRRLLTSVARCGVCGETVHATRSQAGYPVYRCSGPKDHFSRKAEEIEAFVESVVVARLSRPDAVDLILRRDDVDADALRAKRLDLKNRLDSLTRLFVDGVLTETSVRQQSAALKAEIAAVEAQQTDSTRADVLKDAVGPQVAERWASFSTDRRRRIIDLVMRVELPPVGRGRRKFDPATVVITWK